MVINRIAVAWVLSLFAAAILQAASVTVHFKVYDVVSHQPIQALVKGQGPESFSLTLDAHGEAVRELQEGNYLVEISAPGYSTMEPHFLVTPGTGTEIGGQLSPLKPPPEESDDFLNLKMRSGYTLLHGYIFDHASGDPLPGATFELGGIQGQTDPKGHYWLSAPTPSRPSPAGSGTETLIIRRLGYKTKVLHNFLVLADEMSLSNELDKGEGAVNIDATHKMMKDEPEAALTPEAPATNLSPETYQGLTTTGTGMVAGRLQKFSQELV